MRHVALSWLLGAAACSGAGTDPGPTSFSCDQEGFAPDLEEIQYFPNDDLLYYLGTTDGSTQDLLWFEMYFETGAPTKPGTYELTGENYRTCGLCVTIVEDCKGTGGLCGKSFLAQSGTVELGEVGPGDYYGRLEATLRDVELVEVLIDGYSAESTVVDGGETRCLDDFAIAGFIRQLM